MQLLSCPSYTRQCILQVNMRNASTSLSTNFISPTANGPQASLNHTGGSASHTDSSLRLPGKKRRAPYRDLQHSRLGTYSYSHYHCHTALSYNPVFLQVCCQLSGCSPPILASALSVHRLRAQ